MSSAVDGEGTDALVLEYDFDEPPEKVWRAVSVPELREKWLPQELLADGEPVSSVPGKEVRYRMRDDAPPFLESNVTFEVSPRSGGGARLRIIHRLADARIDRRPPAAANSNRTLMRAA
jgi:uncharacterized protein YndB with AHSA1/START domain